MGQLLILKTDSLAVPDLHTRPLSPHSMQALSTGTWGEWGASRTWLSWGATPIFDRVAKGLLLKDVVKINSSLDLTKLGLN